MDADSWLPYFVFGTGLFAFLHALLSYFADTSISLHQFSGPRAPPKGPERQLLAHVYGNKNLFVGAVRLYGSYALARDNVVYDLVMLTYVEVFLLYAGQVFVWQTAKGKDTIVPFVISTVGVVWMLTLRE